MALYQASMQYSNEIFITFDSVFNQGDSKTIGKRTQTSTTSRNIHFSNSAYIMIKIRLEFNITTHTSIKLGFMTVDPPYS